MLNVMRATVFIENGGAKDDWTKHLAMSVFSAIVWGQQYGDVEDLIQHVNRFILDHKGFTQSTPVWYKQ